MVSPWMNLSTRWSLSSVQATLNVIISVLGTVGIWTFSRFWWQRAGTKVVRDMSHVPLPALYTVAAPGDGWDLVALLGKRLLKKDSWHLLFQLVFVVMVTLGTVFSGPIASVTSRVSRTVKKTSVDALQVIKPGGSSANMLEAIVLWNETIESLNNAAFPYDQLQDVLPLSNVNWTYVASEWDPTWTMDCGFTDEIMLHNVSGTGNATFLDPINAFPSFAETYNPSYLDSSKYRAQAEFTSWTAGIGLNAPFTDVLIFVMVLSDPAIDDRWATNNETMQISVSALHLQNVSALNNQWFNGHDRATWRPVGPVANASYTRFECSIIRKPEVPDENLIPWVWTNDTYSITTGYRAMWVDPLASVEKMNITYPTPTSKELFRFYQAYMVTMGTSLDPRADPVAMSVWMNTVQLSIVFLALVVFCTILILGSYIRYLVFLKRHSSQLDEAFVPDGKMQWMVYAARTSVATATEGAGNNGPAPKDSMYFHAATFGFPVLNPELPTEHIRRPSLARVHTRGSSISGPSRGTRESMSKITSASSRQQITMTELREEPESLVPKISFNTVFDTSDADEKQNLALTSRDLSIHSGMTTLHPQTSRTSSTKGSLHPSESGVSSIMLSQVPTETEKAQLSQ